MKVLKKKKVLILHIEYDLEDSGRQKVFDWLDENYGELKWMSRRSGPALEGIGKGLVIAEVDINE